MNQTSRSELGARWSAWLVYVVIVFEIIFMISPAGLYYYSVYGLPLNWLTESPYTSWLVQYVFPHFTYTESSIANFLITISWPLIIAGLLMFLWGFIQIYSSKFRGGGAVVGGLYRYIRHPQYTGLAIAGLGTSIFWSRFLVLIAFVTMMFLYSLLARLEERRCLAAYGDDYQRYLDATGRFLPRGWMPSWTVPRAGVAALYVLALVTVLGGGWLMKGHVIANMMVFKSENLTAVTIAPIPIERAHRVFKVSEKEITRDKPIIAYIAPATWSIPELGLRASSGYNQTGADELAHPTMHGNVPDYEGNKFSVLVATPYYRSPDQTGLNHLISIQPRFQIKVDLESGQVERLENLKPGRWAGIPVPVY